MNEKEIRFIDLFGGIGGFRLGLERANDTIKTRIQQRIKQKSKSNATTKQPFMGTKQFHCCEKPDNIIRPAQQKNSERCNNTKNKLDNRQFFSCVWYCDKDKYSVQTYNKNFKEKYEPTDITTIDSKTIPDFDMLCAGFPCQSFSIAGKRKGFQDIRGTLFFEICRILQAKKPRLVFLENVKGLLSADDGRCFATILSSLDELGYDVEWQVLNSKNFGVPQNRERVFIIGHLRGKSRQEIFPFREASHFIDEWNPEGKPASALQSPGHACGNYRGMTMVRTRSNLEYKEKDIAPSIRHPDKAEVRIIHKTMAIQRFPLKYLTRNQRKIEGDYSFIIDGANTGGVAISNKIRRLTPIECERLQSFPDNWTRGISDTQRYKQLGNAITVNVIQAIGETIEKT